MANCLMCGTELPPDATQCPTCQAAVESAPPPSARPPSASAPPPSITLGSGKPRSFRNFGVGLAALAAVAIVMLAVKVSRVYTPAREPEALIPKSMAIVFNVSLRETWKTLRPFLQESPAALQQLQEFEKKTGLSIDRDLLGSCGDHAAYGMSMPSGMGVPDMVGVVPVKTNMRKARKLWDRLHAATGSGAQGAMKARKYRGVHYWTQGSKPGPMGQQAEPAYGFFKGCAVFATTESAMKKSIDVGLGKLPSIQSTAGYAKVLRSLPRQYVFRCVYDFQELMKGNPAMAMVISEKQKKAMQAFGDYGMTIQLPGGKPRADVALAVTNTPAGREALASWKKCSSVSGSTLAYLPAQPLVIYTFSNPSEVYKQFAKNFDPNAGMFMPPNFKDKFQQAGRLSTSAELAQLCDALTGESSLSLGYLPNKKEIDFLFVSEASNEQALVAALGKIDSAVQSLAAQAAGTPASGSPAPGLKRQRKTTYMDASLRTLGPATPGGMSLAYGQSGAVLFVSNHLSSIKECIKRKQAGSASATSNKDVASLMSAGGKRPSYFALFDPRQLKDPFPKELPADQRKRATQALGRLGLLTSSGSIGGDTYLANMQTTAPLKVIVDSCKELGQIVQQVMMKKMQGGFGTPMPGQTLPGQSMPGQSSSAPPSDVFGEAREKARSASCQSNLKQLDLAMMMYAQDYDERFPISNRWSGGLYPYCRNWGIYACPSAPEKKYGYAMNAKLDRYSMKNILNPAGLGLMYDSSAFKANANDAGKSWCQPPRHSSGNNAAFADGHVKWQQQPPNFDPRK